jgi:DNA mismatch endonuclease (patch repair protein)
MSDNLTKEQRSFCMSKIRSRNTQPELKYGLKNLHLKYQPKIFGSPDFIGWAEKTVVFIDGCFWHKCPKHFIEPKSNKKYWLPKLERNAVRDKEITIAYKTAGWNVIRIWEHDLKN